MRLPCHVRSDKEKRRKYADTEDKYLFCGEKVFKEKELWETSLFSVNYDFVEEIEKRERLSFVERALEKLKGKEKKVVELRYFYGFSIKDISPMVGLSTRGVSLLLQRALSKLRKEARVIMGEVK